MATPLSYAATGSGSGNITAPVANGVGGGLHRPACSTSHTSMQHSQHQEPPSQSPSPSGTAALRTEQKQKLASILDNFPSFDSEIKTGIKVNVGA